MSGFLRELEGLLAHRVTALSGRMSDGGATRAVAEITDFLLLMVCNRALPLIRHLATIENVHPATVFAEGGKLAGELATFMAADKKAPEIPAYAHDNLSRSFAPLMRVLRQYLSSVLEATAISIPLEPRKYGISVGVIADRKLLTTAGFVLAVKADIPDEAVRRHFCGSGQDRPGRGNPAAGELGPARHRAAPLAGGAAPDPLSRRGGVFPA